MRFLRTNTATRITVGPFLDRSDGITPETAITVTAEKLTLVVDTAGVPTLVLDVAPTASGGANDMVHITGDDAGFYDLELAAADVNYLGRAILSLNDVAVHCPVFHEFMILPAVIYDAMVLGTDLFDVSVTQLLGTAWLTPGTAGTPDVNAKLIGGTVQTGLDLAPSLAATYQAKAWLFDDNGGSTDRYAVAWFKNGQPHFTGITSPTIQVIKVADATDLIAATAMTQIGSTGMYRFDEATNRIVNGVAYMLKVTASIDSATRTWVQPIGRDS